MKTFTQKAVYVALASASLMLATSAGAVNVNNDGMGEALIYPYYTVRNNQVTFMSVVNTSAQAKVVKVRVLEGKNSAEVLDFNLWLSMHDVWTAAIFATANGAAIATADFSCTNPDLRARGATGEPFRNAAFVSAGDLPALQTLDRTREGYIELIEMAAVVRNSDTEDDVTHDAGKPTCKLVSNAAVAARRDAGDYEFPNGGLFGNGTIVGASQSTGYNALALEGTDYRGGPTGSFSQNPNLESGFNRTGVVVDSPNSGTSRITAAQFATARDAVSSVIMHSSVMGEYSYNAETGTDWVITMPTKRFYVNSPTVIAPFQRRWNGATTGGTGTACVDISIASYDQEEGTGRSPDDFSPVTEAGAAGLCWESTVVSFDNVTGDSSVVASKNVAHYPAYQAAGKSGGWAELKFGFGAYNPQLVSLPTSQQTLVTASGIGAPTTGAVTFGGLPAVGFAIVSAKFAKTSDNYNSSYSLNFRRSISR
jgi:hypothetical protein